MILDLLRLFRKKEVKKQEEHINEDPLFGQHIITQILGSRYSTSRTVGSYSFLYVRPEHFKKFIERDGLRRFNNHKNYPHEDLETSLEYLASVDLCTCYSEDCHCKDCYFGYLFDLPDECHYNCIFDEIISDLVGLSPHVEECQKAKIEIARDFIKSKRNQANSLDFFKDKILEWCSNYLKTDQHAYLDEVRDKFGLSSFNVGSKKNAR